MAYPSPHFAVHTAKHGKRTGRTTQSWHIGEMVNVGFLRNLMVTSIEATPGDCAPDAYHLVARDGTKYRFVPHNGIERM